MGTIVGIYQIHKANLERSAGFLLGGNFLVDCSVTLKIRVAIRLQEGERQRQDAEVPDLCVTILPDE